MITQEQIEQLAVKHEAFGFGLVDAKGYTTHGFDPDGLHAFVTELLTIHKTPLTEQQIEDILPSGIYDCLQDPWDCGVGDGYEMRSIEKDVIRIVRATEAAHNIKHLEEAEHTKE